jgi:3-phosphoinositide dependent protein kinase-1
MKHQGINKLNYTFQDKVNLYFVQEYCEGGEFINFIKLNISKLTEEVKIFYIAEIINTLEYLHSNGITHRDLKVFSMLLSLKI